jgi:hypothetical protein
MGKGNKGYPQKNTQTAQKVASTAPAKQVSKPAAKPATAPAKSAEPVEKKRPGRNLTFGANEVGVKYIAEAVGTTPFMVREYLRANVRDMEQEKGHAYKFTKQQADAIVEEMKKKSSTPRKPKSSKDGSKEKAKKAKPAAEEKELDNIDEIEAELESLEDDEDGEFYEDDDEVEDE